MPEIIKSPWEETFVELLQGAKEKVYLASPFIKKQTATLIAENTNKGIDLRYINSFKLSNFHRGASDLEALTILDEHKAKQKNVHNLHAKLFIFDNRAVVTSGNLTPGGLRKNLEYGVLLQGGLVKEVELDYLKIFDDEEAPDITPEIIKKADEILSSVPKEKRRKIDISDKALFDEILDDVVVEEKFDGGVESIKANLASWKKEVFECLLEIKSDLFTLDEVYGFEDKLQPLHPDNKNVRPKIRQQLQYLRDIGLVEFLKPGVYRKLWR